MRKKPNYILNRNFVQTEKVNKFVNLKIILWKILEICTILTFFEIIFLNTKINSLINYVN